MPETNLFPEDFDLEAFQEEVEWELSETFDFDPHEEECTHRIAIDLPEGDEIVTTIKHEKIPLPSPISFLFRYPGSLLAIALALLLGFVLGGGNLLVSSLNYNIVVVLSSSLIALTGYSVWKRWRQSKRRREEREEARREEEAKKRIALMQAEELLARNDIRSELCHALKDLSNNVFDMSKSLGPVLLTLSCTGHLPVAITPLLVAAVAVMLAKSGISAYCTEHAKK